MQAVLKQAWTEGAQGRLPAWEEAKAWALREVWRKQHKNDYGLLTFVADRVKKVGCRECGVSVQSISEFFDKVDNDKEWYPGKSTQTQFGPKPAMSIQKQLAVAQSAMAMKSRGQEPTYTRVASTCPRAVLNPTTDKPLDKKRVYDVFREHCYDEAPDKPWKHQRRYSKTALTPDMCELRLNFGKAVQRWGYSDNHYFQKVAWVDICNSILARTEKIANEQALARMGALGWGTEGSEFQSINLVGKKESIKQNSWGTIKIYWIPILVQGKLHVEVMDGSFPGETPEGAAALVKAARVAVNRRFPNARNKPNLLFTDKGKGFYYSNSAPTKEYAKALKDHRFKIAVGTDAPLQPGNFGDVLLHETAIAWLRLRLKQTVPKEAWLETRKEFTTRIKQCAEYINKEYDVEGLCRGFLGRIAELIEKEGDRLRH